MLGSTHDASARKTDRIQGALMKTSFKQFLTTVAEDFRAHGRDWTKPGFRAVAVHRFGVWRMSIRPKLLRAPFSMLYRVAFRRCRNIYGIELPYSVELGRRVVIEHQGGIVIHGNCRIGDDTIIRQNCTLGIRRLDDLHGAPVVGRNVSIGAGAAILGSIKIGDGCLIGANAVVLTDLPDESLAFGVPARVRSLREKA